MPLCVTSKGDPERKQERDSGGALSACRPTPWWTRAELQGKVGGGRESSRALPSFIKIAKPNRKITILGVSLHVEAQEKGVKMLSELSKEKNCVSRSLH